MRTLEKVTNSHDGSTDIDHGWKNSNNQGVVWFINDSGGGTAKLRIKREDGTSYEVQTDAIAADTPTVIIYDFPIAAAIFRFTPSGTGDLTSRLSPKPSR